MKRFFLLLLLSSSILPAASTEENAASTIVIYNQNDPESKDLADFYCAARAINPSQEIGLLTPATEEISRSDYDKTIAAPIREVLTQRNAWMVSQDAENHPRVMASSIRYAALIRGVPLKIKQETNNYAGDNAKLQQEPFGSCNAASVDSELSLLGLYNTQISGVLNNPCFMGNDHPESNSPIPPAFLFVSRLDAPSVEDVKAMILSGLRVEKEGLWGWGYIDLRSLTNSDYLPGDQWIQAAGEAMRKSGIPVITDDLPETFQSGFPITDAAAYFGWYIAQINGPFNDLSFHFLPGAIAAHLHSFSAGTLHNPLKGWTGPLIHHGASASFGNVYEPYLPFTTNFGIMENQLLLGHNLAESYYAAQPVLSWMSILVGDPLYRPYAVLNNRDNKISNIWTDYRRIILLHHGNVLKAAMDLGARAHETHESLYLEALGAAQVDAGFFAAAGASFRDASALAKDPNIQFRLLLEQARVLEKRGKNEKGVTLLRQALLHFTTPPERDLLLLWIQRLDPIKLPSPTPQPTPKQ
jgi:uncharacterized protein (TIGR03790 family)